MSCPRPPAGPRGRIGAAGEDAAAAYLVGLGWTIIGRNLRVDRDEIDIVALEPGDVPALVVVEVRSASTTRFGSPHESVDAGKIRRLYRALMTMRRQGRILPDDVPHGVLWRVDLVSLTSHGGRQWVVDGHLRAVEPP